MASINSSQESLLKEKISEIEKLEKLIDNSLVEVENLRAELQDLEQELNNFLDQYYGSVANFFKNASENPQADNDNLKIQNLDQAKKNLYEKIAKLCCQENFTVPSSSNNDDLLKIEGYLSDGSDKAQSPQDLLSNLIFEYYALMQQMRDLKEKKQNLLNSPAYELKQEIMWANVKSTEIISKIKEDLTHRVNSVVS